MRFWKNYPVDILKIDEIYDTVSRIINDNDECIVDFTGGSELMTIAGYKAGLDNGARLVLYGYSFQKSYEYKRYGTVICLQMSLHWKTL